MCFMSSRATHNLFKYNLCLIHFVFSFRTPVQCMLVFSLCLLGQVLRELTVQDTLIPRPPECSQTGLQVHAWLCLLCFILTLRG